LVLLWFFFVVAWLWATAGGAAQEAPLPVRRLRAGWIAVAAAAVIYAVGHLVLAFGPLGVAERARRVGRQYLVGTYAPEKNETGEFRWTRGKTRLVLPWTGHPLNVRLWAHHPDIKTNPVELTVATPCEMLWSGRLENTSPIDLRLTWAQDVGPLDLKIEVSRTWRPSTYGANDSRRLGLALQTEFNARGASQLRPIGSFSVKPCERGGRSILGGVLGLHTVYTPVPATGRSGEGAE
jgi:hypothetical protein